MAGNKQDINKLLNLSDVEKSLKNIESALRNVNTQISALSKEGKKVADAFSSKGINEQREATDKLKDVNDKLTKSKKLIIQLEREQLRLEEQKKTAQDKELARQKKLINEKEKEAKAREKAAKQAEKEIETSKRKNDLYARESKRLAELKRAYQNLALAGKENTKEGKALEAQMNKLRRSIQKVDDAVGNSQRKVGQYENATKNLKLKMIALGAALVTLAVSGFQKLGQFIGDSVQKFKDYVAVSAKVMAISGASAKEFRSLQKMFKDLGATTKFSAVEVANLALELSKLGFSTKDIKNSTGAILDLSAATGEDLAESARVTASVLKQFQKDTSETGNVADIMAKAFSNSALDLEKFDTAMRNVGPAANAVEVSLEETTATLGKIVDAGIDASSAGAALRNVYIDLADKGLTWEEAMNKINGSTNKLSAANQLFGKRGAVVATVIANSTESTAKLTKALENSAGAAKRMADIMSNNLEGDMKAAESATEALQIALGERFNDALRNVVQGWRDMVLAIKDFVEVDPSEQLRKERDELNLLVPSIVSVKDNEELRLKMINDLQKAYPDFLGNIDAENVSNEQLVATLKRVNTQYENRIQIALLGEQIAEREKKITEEYELQKNTVREFNKVFAERFPEAEKNLSIQEQYNLLVKEGAEQMVVSGGRARDTFKDLFFRYENSQKRIKTEQEGINDLMNSQMTWEERIAAAKRRQEWVNNQNKKLSGDIADDKGKQLDTEKKITKEKEKQKVISHTEKRAALGFEIEKDTIELSKWHRALEEGTITVEEYNAKLKELGFEKLGPPIEKATNELDKLKSKFDEMKKGDLGAVDTEKEGMSLLDRMGISIDQEKFDIAQGLAEESISMAFDMQQQIVQADIERLDAELEISNERIENKQNELDSLIEKDKELIKSGDTSLKAEIRQKKEELANEKKMQAAMQKERKAAAEKQKDLAIAQATIDFGAELAAIALYASSQPANTITAGGFGAAVLVAQAAIATAGYISNINQIKKAKYAKGGYTGDDVTFRDETGEHVAGIVHKKEWVFDKHITAENREFFNYLQNGGIAQDYFINPVGVGVPVSNDNNLQIMYLKKQIEEQQKSTEYLKKIHEKPERQGNKTIFANGSTKYNM